MEQHDTLLESNLSSFEGPADIPRTTSVLSSVCLEGNGVKQERNTKGELLLSSAKSFYQEDSTKHDEIEEDSSNQYIKLHSFVDRGS